VPHPAPAAGRKQKKDASVLPLQADLNAAANLALRAVAHPGCANIHHRLRTESKKEGLFTRERRRFGKEKLAIIAEKANGLPKERNTNLFFDEHGVADFGRARLQTDDASTFAYASGPALWKTVNDRVRQWERCQAINARRQAHWNGESHDDVPM
jgi:hypothetical protein